MSTTTSVTKEWITVAELCELLSIGRTKAYELIATGELSAVQIGRCIRVNRTELEDWLRDQRYSNAN